MRLKKAIFKQIFLDTCVTIVCRGVNWTRLDRSAYIRAPKQEPQNKSAKNDQNKQNKSAEKHPACLMKMGNVNFGALVSALGARSNWTRLIKNLPFHRNKIELRSDQIEIEPDVVAERSRTSLLHI